MILIPILPASIYYKQSVPNPIKTFLLLIRLFFNIIFHISYIRKWGVSGIWGSEILIYVKKKKKKKPWNSRKSMEAIRRENEIKEYGKLISLRPVSDMGSKKIYKRKKFRKRDVDESV